MDLRVLICLTLCAAGAAARALRNVQVAAPVHVPEPDAPVCEQALLRHVFPSENETSSWGRPALVDYEPACAHSGPFTAIVLDLHVASAGRQYDRLAGLFLEGVERSLRRDLAFADPPVWRTSTAEPTPSGIVWDVERDVTRFASLLVKPGRLVFDLGNTVAPDVNLTGRFDVRLSARFYGSAAGPPTPTPDVVIPISRRSRTESSWFGEDSSVWTTLPADSYSVVAEVLASGNAQEEFWALNAHEAIRREHDVPALGCGPRRELQLFVDGALTGFAAPWRASAFAHLC